MRITKSSFHVAPISGTGGMAVSINFSFWLNRRVEPGSCSQLIWSCLIARWPPVMQLMLLTNSSVITRASQTFALQPLHLPCAKPTTFMQTGGYSAKKSQSCPYSLSPEMGQIHRPTSGLSLLQFFLIAVSLPCVGHWMMRVGVRVLPFFPFIL